MYTLCNKVANGKRELYAEFRHWIETVNVAK